MINIIKKTIFTIVMGFAVSTSAFAQQQTVYDRQSIQCIGTELDGSQTLRVTGYGRNRIDAKEQAMKNAVWAVVFDGVRDGGNGCNLRPLVTEVNARERYEDYFNIFFSDKGEYKKYVSLRDTKRQSAGRKKDKIGYSYEMTVRVLRSELKARLKADNVISSDHL